jgi:hypothetical protein
VGSVALIQNYFYVSHGIWVSDLLTKLLCFDFLKRSGPLVQIYGCQVDAIILFKEFLYQFLYPMNSTVHLPVFTSMILNNPP